MDRRVDLSFEFLNHTSLPERFAWLREFSFPTTLIRSQITEFPLEPAVTAVYQRIQDEASNRGLAPIRHWNFIPGILDDLGGGINRYHDFNRGRFLGMGRPGPGVPPAATGVGSRDHSCWIYTLMAEVRAQHLTNPRQIPAPSYSEQWGPLPPAFSRATLIPEHGVLLVSGTASVVGEESAHPESLDDQLEETFRNLEVLLEPDGASFRPIHICTYHPRAEDGNRIRTAVAARFPDCRTLRCETVSLCRPELLVEIELAAIQAPSTGLNV
jgi:enamine deaminase RidA (YjgF/YER057c/UK114 family)